MAVALFDAAPRSGRSWRLRLAGLRFGVAPRIDFYINLAFALERGLMQRDALERLLEMERDLPRGLLGRPLLVILPHWLQRLGAGERLSEAVTPWVGTHEATNFAAAARDGITPRMLRDLAEDMRRLSKLSRLMLRGVVPLGLTLLIIWSCFAASHWWMFPVFEEMGDGAIAWIGLAGWLHDVSHSMAVFVGPAVLAAILAGIPVMRLALRRWTGRGRVLADYLVPGFGVHRRFVGVSWMLAMAAMLDARRTPRGALEALRPTATPYLRERLDAALNRADLEMGDALLVSGLRWPDIQVIHRVRLSLASDHPGQEFRALAAHEFERLEAGIAAAAAATVTAGEMFFTAFILLVIFAQNDIALSLR